MLPSLCLRPHRFFLIGSHHVAGKWRSLFLSLRPFSPMLFASTFFKSCTRQRSRSCRHRPVQWVGAEDPALAFATQRPVEARLRALPRLRHIPSYLAIEPTLKVAPPLFVDLRTPSSQPPGAVPITHAQVPPATSARATTFSFSTELNSLGAPHLPGPSFAASNNESPDNIHFRVAVGARGDIRYCFPLNTSGDPALDEQARQYLMLCRFPGRPVSAESGRSLIWGIATIEWGNDVARPPATSTTTGAQ